MLILGVDTSTETGAVALQDEERLLGEININFYRRHSKRLIPTIKYLFQETEREMEDLTGIAVTTGPGSYTGLRIGLSTVKAFAHYLQIPVVGLSTLSVLAYAHYQLKDWLVPVIDARRERVYTALFQGGERDIQESRRWEDEILPLQELLQKLNNFAAGEKFYFTGNATFSYQEELLNSELNIEILPSFASQPRGAIITELGKFYLERGVTRDFYQLLPAYLQKPGAEIKYKQGD